MGITYSRIYAYATLPIPYSHLDEREKTTCHESINACKPREIYTPHDVTATVTHLLPPAAAAAAAYLLCHTSVRSESQLLQSL